MRKCFCAVLALVIAVSCLCTSALAMGNESNGEEMIIARATGRFIPAGSFTVYAKYSAPSPNYVTLSVSLA